MNRHDKELHLLHVSLRERWRPEDVADLVMQLVGDRLAPKEHRILSRASRGSLRNSVAGYSSMAMQWGKVVGAGKQVAKAVELFALEAQGSINSTSPEAVMAFVAEISALIGKTPGANNFVKDRLNKSERETAGMDISKRQYNKRWRMLMRLEERVVKIAREQLKLSFTMMGKHGLAHRLDWDSFSYDLDAACFIAYYTARCNLRSRFTMDKQDRPYDEIAEMLFKRVQAPRAGVEMDWRELPANTAWWAMAHVFPQREVLEHLGDGQKGQLLGIWTGILKEVADLLGELWEKGNFSRTDMVVHRGDDSSTWNNTASAWNKARDNWMQLIHALGMEQLLEVLCFGKVMRLMAGDVAYLHRTYRSGLDPNTAVWAALPTPWDVFQGKATCGRDLVVRACKQVGLNPESSGWVAPRSVKVSQYRPTPELVHGVEVSSPFLAKLMRQHGWFSGKHAKPLYLQ